MASPVGHALVGLTLAAFVAKVTGAALSFPLWIGAFVASGLPDLDVFLGVFGLTGPRYHRNASHSLVVLVALIAVVAAVAHLALGDVDWRIALAWAAALLSHPLLDVLTSGPDAARRGYGISLLWPFSKHRWYLARPVVETADFDACHSISDLWHAVLPEFGKLGLPALVLLILLLIL